MAPAVNVTSTINTTQLQDASNCQTPVDGPATKGNRKGHATRNANSTPRGNSCCGISTALSAAALLICMIHLN